MQLIMLLYGNLLQDLCNSHYGKGAKIWALQKTLTNSTKCIHKIHMVLYFIPTIKSVHFTLMDDFYHFNFTFQEVSFVFLTV